MKAGDSNREKSLAGILTASLDFDTQASSESSAHIQFYRGGTVQCSRVIARFLDANETSLYVSIIV